MRLPQAILAQALHELFLRNEGHVKQTPDAQVLGVVHVGIDAVPGRVARHLLKPHGEQAHRAAFDKKHELWRQALPGTDASHVHSTTSLQIDQRAEYVGADEQFVPGVAQRAD